MKTHLLFTIGALALSTGALASDGRLQINQTCLQYGCFDGDSFGAPVTITQPGSYQLTSNLTVTGVDDTAIVVTANDVNIDLNGFSIVGPVTCDNAGTCSATSSSTSTGIGIDASSASAGRVTVHNGTVRGMGGRGVVSSSGFNNRLNDLTISSNGREGLLVLHGLAKNVVAARNGDIGINASILGTLRVLDSVVRNNHSRGILGGYCSGLVSQGNGTTSLCIGLGPNQCENPSNCD